MCLILIAMQQSEQFPFILAANRDEFYKRPSAQAEYWQDHRDVLAGRDLQALGTWLGISRSGKIAAVTNHHLPETTGEAPRSRGELVSEFLTLTETTDQYSERVRASGNQYNGFGLLVGDSTRLRYQSNESEHEADLTDGVYALGNTLLNSPGPRAQAGIRLFEDMLRGQRNVNPQHLFEILINNGSADSAQSAGNDDSKSSGPAEIPIFVNLENYGTRCSTVIMVDSFKNIYFEERTHYENAKRYRSRRSFAFSIAG